MNLRARFITILFVISISFLLVWPNVGVRKLLVYLDEGLDNSEIEDSIKNLKMYIAANYPKQYKIDIEEKTVGQNWSEQEIQKIIKEGRSAANIQKEREIQIEGRFIQTAFINELGRLENIDSQRSRLLPLWVEENIKARPFKLGLDLQGGMNLLLEADFEKLLSKLKEQYSTEYISGLDKKIKDEKDKDKKENLKTEREQIFSLLELTPQKKKEYVEGALEIIRSRIDKTGVSEPLIRLQGEDKIEVSMPGVSSPEQAKKLIKSTAQVSYHLSEPDPAPFTRSANTYFQSYLEIRSTKRRQAFVKEIEKKINLPKQFGIYVFWAKDRNDVTSKLDPQNFMVLEKKPSLSGEHISPNTYVGFDPDSLQNIISFQLTPEGSSLFGDLTKKNTGRRMAIIIDDKIRSAPNINEPILGGSAQISGDFSPQEAKDLALIIKEGALPVPMNITQERSIGPTLGKESIEKGVYSILIGFLAVGLFMILYYSLAGLIANISLLLNLLIMSAILALMDFTITLPGLAGVVLTLGMAVDANVIIYERIKEELGRQKITKAAVSQGFERATLSIIDSNLTTVVAAIVLSQFGIGPIKGFAITLFIGILSSLFTSLFVSRTIFHWLTFGLNLKKIPMGFVGGYRKKIMEETRA